MAFKRLSKLLLTVMLSMSMAESCRSASPSVTIVDSGSTNRPGMRVTVDIAGHAHLSTNSQSSGQQFKVSEQLSARFAQLVKAARPLQKLPAQRCMKSASFGSQLFIEYEGERTPDLSCPVQSNENAAALQKAANEILQAAREHAPQPLFR